MADLLAGPNAPLSRAFLFCGWHCIPVDWLLDPSHDLSCPERQQSLAEQLSTVDFICAAMDCSTKSRAREIPRSFDDGRPAPRPLRSVEFPEGLPQLSSSEQARVDTDNAATSFILGQIQMLAERGGGSIRENPWRSLHWHLPQEKAMMDSGHWRDKRYASCCLMGARSKSQCLRHNLDEIDQWPPLDCHHFHHAGEWDPYTVEGKRVYPSHEEAEYTAPLAFAIAVSASWWAARTGRVTLKVPRMPAFGRRDHWLGLDPQTFRSWAMTPLAITLGLSPPHPAEAARVPKRARVLDMIHSDSKTLPPNCIYVEDIIVIVSPPPSGNLSVFQGMIAHSKTGAYGTCTKSALSNGINFMSSKASLWYAIALILIFVRPTFWQGWSLTPLHHL